MSKIFKSDIYYAYISGAIIHIKFFQNIHNAVFKSRPNRFLVECSIKGRDETAHLPNPGRLWELLLPGSRLYLTKHRPSDKKKTRYTVVAVEKDGAPVMLHTHINNSVAEWLIEQNKVPGLEGYSIVRSEVPMGRSRFDFLLEKGKKKLILEVKSCTLFSKEIAMFPDAVTERGRKHVIELADLSQKGFQGALLFVVHWPHARFFLPEYHTDLAFARTLLELKDHLLIQAIAIEWKKDLTLGPAVHPLEIPWNLVERESHDSGSYMLILYLEKDHRIRIGHLGEIPFKKGYYLYVGSARKNLGKRIERHRRSRKKLFWHIDYLREHAEFCTALPVRTGASLECEMAKKMNEIADVPIPGFGASDCRCNTHLFGFRSDPLKTSSFINAVHYFRMGRLHSQNLS